MEPWYSQISFEELTKKALEGLLNNRIATWRILLGMFSGPYEAWVQTTWDKRQEYYELKAKLEPKLNEELDPLINNPLSVSNSVSNN